MSIDSKCIEKTNVTKVKVEEKGRKAVFLNTQRQSYTKIMVDGCVLKNTLAADWIVGRQHAGYVVVELKGKGVEHGAQQVFATAEHWDVNGLCSGQVAGLIVATQYPRASTTIQRAKQSFSKRFKGPLHVVTSNFEGELENVLSFKGPYGR